jgi:hypothetical protein
MPLYLKEVDVIPEVSKFKSALIVPCRLCPAASFSLRKQKPFIELFRRLLKNEAYDQYLNQLRINLEKKGLRTDVAKGNIPKKEMEVSFMNSHKKADGVSPAGPST